MAVDYSIPGKGNERKTGYVINEYLYDTTGKIIKRPWEDRDSELDSENQRMHDSDRHDWKADDSDLQIQIWDNDSDIQYLYDVTVKFRGTIDPTTELPFHNEIKPGDLYISRTAGSVMNGWAGIEANGVGIGEAMLYTDSDIWIFLGTGGGSDSDTITMASSLAWVESITAATDYRRHTDFKKILATSTTRSMYMREDSDNTWMVHGEAPGTGSTVFDAELMSTTDLWISTSKGGPSVQGRIGFWDETLDSELFIDSLLNNVNGTIANAITGDSEVVISLIDERIDAFGIRLKKALIVGHEYRVKYEDLATNEITYLYSPTGEYFRRMMPWEKLRRDHDSEHRDYMAYRNDTSSRGYPVGSIIAFSHHDLPPGFRVADGTAYDTFQYPELFQKLGTNILPDLRGQFLRGTSDSNVVDPSGPRTALSTQSDAFRSHSHSATTTTRHKDVYWDWTTLEDGTLSKASETGDASTNTNVVTTSIGSTGGAETRPKNTAVVYGIAMYSGAGLLYDSDIVYSVMMEHFIGRLDSEDARLDSEIIMLRHDVKAWDSDYDSENKRMHDSDRHDWKAGDSDLLAQTGRTFVGNTLPAPVSPDLRDGDTWIDTDDNRMYFYQESLGSWIQVLGTV